MKHALAILIVLASPRASCDEPQSLRSILKLRPQKGLVLLDQGYRGKWTQKFSDDSTGQPFDNEPLEFTHGRIATRRDDKSLTLHELVVATSNGPGDTASTYRAPTLWIKKKLTLLANRHLD